MVISWDMLNSLRPKQNGRHFPDDSLKCIFLNENVWIPIKTSLKFVPKGPINIIPALVQIMAWRRPGDKPLSEPMMVSLPTHICVSRPQGVKVTFQEICTGFVLYFISLWTTIYFLVYFMMTSSNENIFKVTGPLCGEFTGHRLSQFSSYLSCNIWGSAYAAYPLLL